MIKLICIIDVYQAKEGEIYYTDENYYSLDDNDDIWIEKKTVDVYCIPIGVYQKKYFLSESEFREKQIKSVLDDN